MSQHPKPNTSLDPDASTGHLSRRERWHLYLDLIRWNRPQGGCFFFGPACRHCGWQRGAGQDGI
jgi:hypothetical protein